MEVDEDEDDDNLLEAQMWIIVSFCNYENNSGRRNGFKKSKTILVKCSSKAPTFPSKLTLLFEF